MEPKKRELETVTLRELTVQMCSGLTRTLTLEPGDELHIVEGEDEIRVKQHAFNEEIRIQSVYVEIYGLREYTVQREKVAKKISETALAPSAT